MSESELELQNEVPDPKKASDSESAPSVEEEATEESAESPEQERRAEERRQTYRLNKVLGATLTSTDGGSKATRLFVIDISVTGFRATDHQPPEQEECEISIVLDKGAEPFVSPMRVVWVKELTVSGMYQMGCEFVGPAADQVEKLSSFIERERGQVVESKPVSFGTPWTMINN